MATSATEIRSKYPLPAYNYRVTVVLSRQESATLGFSEVSGLKLEYEPVTYKHGMSFLGGSNNVPGARQPIRITLKRGIAIQSNFLQDWLDQTTAAPYSLKYKHDVVVDLCDEKGVAMVSWVVKQAFPVKLEAPTFSATSNEVAIETLELVATDLQIKYQALQPGS